MTKKERNRPDYEAQVAQLMKHFMDQLVIGRTFMQALGDTRDYSARLYSRWGTPGCWKKFLDELRDWTMYHNALGDRR